MPDVRLRLCHRGGGLSWLGDSAQTHDGGPFARGSSPRSGGRRYATGYLHPCGSAITFGTEVDWAYMTEPEPALDGRSIYHPRGKVLGGSSNINGMIYIRGNRRDFDRWEAAGNAGWGYESVLPYFRRAEGNDRGADHYHGADGPLAVCDNLELDPRSNLPRCCQRTRVCRKPGFQRSGAGRVRAVSSERGSRAPDLERGGLPSARGESTESYYRDKRPSHQDRSHRRTSHRTEVPAEWDRDRDWHPAGVGPLFRDVRKP